jgi:hypothetical protein
LVQQAKQEVDHEISIYVKAGTGTSFLARITRRIKKLVNVVEIYFNPSRDDRPWNHYVPT